MNAQEGRPRYRLRPDVILTLVAVAAGAGGAWLGGRYLQQRAAAAEAQLESRYAGREVVVAATDVTRGSVLSSANLAVRSVPQDFLPPDAVPARRAAELIGGTTAIDIARGTPIVPAVLATRKRAERLSAILAQDERALTVSVDDLDSQAGGLRAGDRVDLFYSQRSGGGALLVPLLQQVEILGVGESFNGEDASGRPMDFTTVTLRVAAADAPRVLLAQQAGELSVLLRNPGDTATLPVAVRSSAELLRAPVARRSSSQIELLIGGEGGQVPQRRLISTGTRAGDAS